MQGLMLHAGARSVTYNELASLPLPTSLGTRHQPFPFHYFIDEVKNHLERDAFKVSAEAYGLSKDGNKFFGLLELEDSFDGFAPFVGLRASHDRSLSRSIGIGGRVFVCDNLAFVATHKISALQTKNCHINLQQRLEKVVNEIPVEISTLDDSFKRWRDSLITEQKAAEGFIEAIRRDILPCSKAEKAIELWDEEESKYGDKTAYRFHNVITEALTPIQAPNDPTIYQNRTLKLNYLVDEILV
jgi:hypothetical protein